MKSAFRFCLTVCLLCTASSRAADDDVIYLDQGLSAETRQDYYYDPQGSSLMPYDWFLALEQSARNQLFRNDDHIRSFGYLPNEKNESNPDGLPVGLQLQGPAFAESKLLQVATMLENAGCVSGTPSM